MKKENKEIVLINPADYMAPDTWAEKVGLSGRRVYVLLKEDRIPEVVEIGGKKFIHKNAPSPSRGNGRPPINKTSIA